MKRYFIGFLVLLLGVVSLLPAVTAIQSSPPKDAEFTYARIRYHMTPDAIFVNVTKIPDSGKCNDRTDLPPGEFKAASPELIKGTLSDKLGIKACVSIVKGWEELALRAQWVLSILRGVLSVAA